MDKQQIIEAAEQFVRGELEKEASGHDWWHIYRVTQMAKKIAEMEGADRFICELAALLHDLADEKITKSEAYGMQKITTWLQGHGVIEEIIAHIIDIIGSISFKGGNRPPMKTLEGKVVQDADRLDAIGAVGISRVFAFSGAKGRLIHDPDRKPRENISYEAYRSGEDTAINHFYEKLLKLKDLMNTEYGKKIAMERHQYMEGFLQRFYLEWEGLK